MTTGASGADRVDAIVVGSGPNGLAAAVTLARAGLQVAVHEAADEIGGGTRTAELTLPGLRHDVCSAFHPFGAASPFFATLPLEEHGLRWRWPEVQLAHPLDDGTAAALHRSVEQTADELGADGDRWRRYVLPLVDRFDDLRDELLRPVLHVPRYPVLLGRFGLPAMLPATVLARRFSDERTRALLAGCAGHSIRPLNRPATSAIGLMLLVAGHAVGWPVAEGGSHAIARALASVLRSLGGTIETGVRVTSLADLPPARAVLFDTTPAAVLDIAGDRVPARVASAFRRFRHGAAVHKVDLAVEGGVPWSAESCRRAGTGHVGGSAAEIAAAEADVHRGRMPARPFVLVGQQHVCDPTRSVGDVHPVWAYAHVPHGYGGDATEAVLDQIERFAPGVRERIVGRATMSPAELERHNANYRGGDIATGANSLRQLVFRPRVGLDPYTVGPGLYLCSAATPPGGGVHGMCGHNAATRALRDLTP